jgi:hypothetical protein
MVRTSCMVVLCDIPETSWSGLWDLCVGASDYGYLTPQHWPFLGVDGLTHGCVDASQPGTTNRLVTCTQGGIGGQCPVMIFTSCHHQPFWTQNWEEPHDDLPSVVGRGHLRSPGPCVELTTYAYCLPPLLSPKGLRVKPLPSENMVSPSQSTNNVKEYKSWQGVVFPQLNLT